MRACLLAILLLLPSASAASQVHVNFVGDAYAVTFVSKSSTAPALDHEGGHADVTRVTAPGGDDDLVYRARIPTDARRYDVEGRSFEIGAPPAATATVRVAWIADIGTDANATLMRDAVMRAKPSLVIFGGDLSYANGDPSVWNAWFDLFEPLAATTPIMPIYGNHEDYCTMSGVLKACGVDSNGWRQHFALPNGDKLYYDFDWGPLHVTALDTEAYESPKSQTVRTEQAAFLDRSLANDSGQWQVVAFHRALRTTNTKDELGSDTARNALAPRLDGRADLVLQAHVHAYEREKIANGTAFVTSGGGGRSVYADWGPMAPWVEKRSAELQFLLIEASPTKLTVTAIRPDDSTLDKVTLERSAPAPPTSATPTASTPHGTPTSEATPTSGATPLPTESKTVPGAPALAALLVALTVWRRRAARNARG